MPGGLKKKRLPENYNMGGGTMMPNTMMPKAPMSSMYRAGGKLYMGGGATMKDNTPSFKDEMQKKFGGGMTDMKMSQPAMKKNK